MDRDHIVSGLLDIYNKSCSKFTEVECLLTDLYLLESAKNTILLSYRVEEETKGVRDGVDSMLLRKYKDIWLKYYYLAKEASLSCYFKGEEACAPGISIRNYEALMRELYVLYLEPLLFEKKDLSEYAFGGLSIAEIEGLKAKSKNKYYAYHDFILKLKKENSFTIEGIRRYIFVELEKNKKGEHVFEALTPAYLAIEEFYMGIPKRKRYFTISGLRMGFLWNRVGNRMRKSIENKGSLENGGFERLVKKYQMEPSVYMKRIYSVLSEIESSIEDGVYMDKIPTEYSLFVQSSIGN